MATTTDPHGRNRSSVYRRMCRKLKYSPEGRVCWICGKPINVDLPASEFNNPEYWTADHDPPLGRGGELLKGIRPAHKSCNSSEGGKLAHPPKYTGVEVEHSRVW